MASREAMLIGCLGRARRTAFYASRLPATDAFDPLAFAELPLTRKRDLREHGPAAFLCEPLDGWLQYHESFGTTGPPAGSWFSRRDYERDLHRTRHWSAPFNRSRVLIRFPYALSMPAHLAQRAALARGAVVFGASSRDTVCPHSRAVRLLKRMEIAVLACSPFEALLLAEATDLLSIRSTSVKTLCVAGELLSDGYRGLLQDSWSASVNNLYGSTETGAIATSCDRGCLHLCDGQWVEVVEERDPSRVRPAGEIGRVVVTTLDREAMPLVRYDTGDLASWLPYDACSCGRPGAVLELHGCFRGTCGRTERELQDLACTIAREQQARFIAATIDEDALEVQVESTVTGDENERRDGLQVSIRRVALGSLVDHAALVAEPSAAKPRLVRRRAKAVTHASAGSSPVSEAST